jgi:DNA invertase Pin-like site-specific DNA recombinase
MGEAVFQIIAILKAIEVQVLSERTKDGLSAARARGKQGGRLKGSYDKNKAAAAVTLYNRKLPISEITNSLKIPGLELIDDSNLEFTEDEFVCILSWLKF